MNTGRLVTVYRRATWFLIFGLLALRGMSSIDAGVLYAFKGRGFDEEIGVADTTVN